MFPEPPASPFDPPSLLYVFFTSPLKFLLRYFYQSLTYPRSGPPTGRPAIRIVCISDTHCNIKPIPDGDLLIHAGDFTNAGTPSEIQAQVNWLESLPHAHKICISGNHDTYLDPRSRRTLPPSDRDGHIDWKGIHYLQHDSLTLTFPRHQNRRLRFFGAPQIPACGGPEFSFQYPRGQDAWTNTVPVDTDVLITHTPPKYHLDLPAALGCEYLLRETWRVRPRLHVFGHVHAGRGQEVVYWDDAQRAYEAALQRPDGLIRSTLDMRLWIEAVRVVVYGVSGLLWNRVWGGREEPCRLVNASLMFNNTGRIENDAQIVEI